MEQVVSKFLSALSRRRLFSGLSLTAAAVAATGAAAPAQAAASATPIVRKNAIPGLAAPGTAAKPSYSHVVSTTRKKMIFVAGQLARDKDGKAVGVNDPKAQLRQVFENIKLALAAEGATFADITQTQTFVTSWDKFREASDVRYEYLGPNLPTSTTIEISKLAFPEALFEINCIAMVDA